MPSHPADLNPPNAPAPPFAIMQTPGFATLVENFSLASPLPASVAFPGGGAGRRLDPQAAREAAAAAGWTLERLLSVIGNRHCLRILELLLAGRTVHSTALGREIGRSRDSTQKHLAALHRLGLVEETQPKRRDNRATFYRLAAPWRPAPASPRELELGLCTLRFPAVSEAIR